MEIKVGEYVKCKDGIIAKIINKSEEDYAERGNILYELDKETFDDTEGFEEYSYYALPDQFTKHSKNIIDLIEVGDYINGSKLLSIDYAEDKFGNCDKLHYYYSFEDGEKDVNEYYEELIVKSIVTKEQFKSIEYRLGN